MQLCRQIYALWYEDSIALYRVSILGFYLERNMRQGSQHKSGTTKHTYKEVLLGYAQSISGCFVAIPCIVGGIHLAPHLGQIDFHTPVQLHGKPFGTGDIELDSGFARVSPLR